MTQHNNEKCCSLCLEAIWRMGVTWCTDKDCPCHQNTTTGWEKDFDERFPPKGSEPSMFFISTFRLAIKAFIRETITHVRSEARKEGANEVRSIVVGWRERDWPEGFDRKTAQIIADDLIARTPKHEEDKETTK